MDIGGYRAFDETGEKWQFNGKVYGELAGGAAGVGAYHGPVPNHLEKWNCYLGAGDAGAGGLYVIFNPVSGPHARFVAATGGGRGVKHRLRWGNLDKRLRLIEQSERLRPETVKVPPALGAP